MAADEPRCAVARLGGNRVDQRQLGRADVGDDALVATRLERADHELRERPHGRRAEDEVGAGNGLPHRPGAAVERAELDRALDSRRIRIESRDLGVEPPARCEPDRASDQPDA
jgi:hypothetical protein